MFGSRVRVWPVAVESTIVMKWSKYEYQSKYWTGPGENIAGAPVGLDKYLRCLNFNVSFADVYING